MKRSTGSILCLLSLVLLPGCSSLLDVQSPDYNILRVVPRVALAFPLDRSTIDLEFLVEVDNPNSFALNMERIEFDLFIDDRKVFDGLSNRDIRVPANGIGEVTLETRIGYQEIREIFREIADVVRGGDADYRIEGKAWYRTRLGTVGLPFTVRD